MNLSRQPQRELPVGNQSSPIAVSHHRFATDFSVQLEAPITTRADLAPNLFHRQSRQLLTSRKSADMREMSASTDPGMTFSDAR